MTDNYKPTTWFVTGATGLVGSAIVEKLRVNDINVIALARRTSNPTTIEWLESLEAKVIYGDLLDTDSYGPYLATSDVVVHAAAAVQIRDIETNWKVNYEGTRRLVEAMKEFGIYRLIHISTAGLYEVTNSDTIDESRSDKPYGPYLESKKAAEEFILSETGVKSTSIRPPFIYGPIERDRHSYKTIFSMIPKLMVPKILGKDAQLGFVHSDDIAKLVLLVGTVESTNSVVYNVQSFEVKFTELVRMTNNARSANSRIIPVPYLFFGLVAWVGDLWNVIRKQPFGLRERVKIFRKNWTFSTQLAENDLGFIPMHTDPKELEIMLEDYYLQEIGVNEDKDMRELMQE